MMGAVSWSIASVKPVMDLVLKFGQAFLFQRLVRIGRSSGIDANGINPISNVQGVHGRAVPSAEMAMIAVSAPSDLDTANNQFGKIRIYTTTNGSSWSVSTTIASFAVSTPEYWLNLGLGYDGDTLATVNGEALAIFDSTSAPTRYKIQSAPMAKRLPSVTAASPSTTVAT